MSLVVEDRKKRDLNIILIDLTIFLLTYVADMVFPSGMIINIDPKEFSYARLL